MRRTCLSLAVVMLACLRAHCFIARAPATHHALTHAAAAVVSPAAAAVRARSALFVAAKRRTSTAKAAAEPPKAKAAEGEHKFAQLGRVLSDFRVSEAKVTSIFTALNDYDSMDELITLAAPYAQRSPSELASRLEEKYKVKPAESDILSSALLQLAGQNQQRATTATVQPPSMPICHTKVVGTTFQSIPWDTLKAGDVLQLRHETNQHDADAVAVYHNDTKLGFIGKELVQAQQLHVDTAQYWAEITNITGGGDKRHGCNIRIFYSSENGKPRAVKPAQPFAAGAAKPSRSTPAAFPSGKPAYQKAPSATGAQQFGRAPSKPVYASGAAPAAKSAKGSDKSFVGFSKVLGVSSYPVPWDQIAVDDRLDFVLDEKKNQVAIVHSKTQQKMGHVNPQIVESYSIMDDIKSKRYDWWAVVSNLTGGKGRQQGCNIHVCSNKPPQGTK